MHLSTMSRLSYERTVTDPGYNVAATESAVLRQQVAAIDLDRYGRFVELGATGHGGFGKRENFLSTAP